MHFDAVDVLKTSASNNSQRRIRAVDASFSSPNGATYASPRQRLGKPTPNGTEPCEGAIRPCNLGRTLQGSRRLHVLLEGTKSVCPLRLPSTNRSAAPRALEKAP